MKITKYKFKGSTRRWDYSFWISIAHSHHGSGSRDSTLQRRERVADVKSRQALQHTLSRDSHFEKIRTHKAGSMHYTYKCINLLVAI